MLKIHNTLSGKKEKFSPAQKGKVSMYVCGVTPYDYSHIGHARCYVSFDVVKRYLRNSGYEVTHVQNFTDVDDKIIRRASEQEKSATEISEFYSKEFLREFDSLNVERAGAYPKVTQNIPEIVAFIGRLISKGFAYESGGDVFFEVSKFKDYGKLSRQSLDELIKGKRVEINENKRSPADFALWKAAKPGEPSWDSPWGRGRPGWHIECSVMSTKHLGSSFDIHGGGLDLIFPHHENEVAQSEAATGVKPFVKYWMHNGFVTVNKEKMAKSLGNFFTLKDALEKFDADTIRFFILSTHYRQPIDFSTESLQQAKEKVAKLRQALEKLEAETHGKQAPTLTNVRLKEIESSFANSMDDDFNTAGAVVSLFEAKDFALQKIDSGDAQALGETLLLFRQICGVLGLFEKQRKEAKKGGEAGIEALVLEREKARKEKDYKAADEVREKLKKMGILIEDTAKGVRWYREN